VMLIYLPCIRFRGFLFFPQLLTWHFEALYTGILEITCHAN
jgi:hypothetical protein